MDHAPLENRERVSLIQSGTYRALLLLVVTVFAVWAMVRILEPFLLPIAWALCLAAVTAKPYRWLARRLGRPRLAAGIMTIAVCVLVIGPVVLTAILLVEELGQFGFDPLLDVIRTHLPNVQQSLEDFVRSTGLSAPDAEQPLREVFENFQNQLPDSAPKVLMGGLASGTFTVLAAPFVFLLGFLLALATLYFVYVDAPRLRALVVDLVPISTGDTDRVLETLRGTTSAAIVGGVLVALIQGALGGAALAIAGFQSVILWSFVMAMFSFLPFGGAALVWVPAGVYLLVTGQTGMGIFVMAWGTVIVGTVDNLLRPWILTKTGAKDIHPLLLFFAILSGLGMFGMSGIVFGPLLLAFLTTIVQIYRDRALRLRARYALQEGQGEAEAGAAETAP